MRQYFAQKGTAGVFKCNQFVPLPYHFALQKLTSSYKRKSSTLKTVGTATRTKQHERRTEKGKKRKLFVGTALKAFGETPPSSGEKKFRWRLRSDGYGGP